MTITRRAMLAASAGAFTATSVPDAVAQWVPSTRYPDSKIKILDPSFARYRLNNAGVERLTHDLRQRTTGITSSDTRIFIGRANFPLT